MTTTTGMSVRRRTMVTALGVFALLAAVTGVAATAWACSVASASTSISPKVGAPGSEVTVSGANYAHGPVEIRWNGASGPVLATTQGPDFSQVVNVPPGATAGMAYIAAVQRDAAGAVTYKVADTFEITDPAAAATATSGVPSATATGDLWSGFAAGPGLSTSDDAATAPAPDSSSSRNLALGVGLMGAGTAALFGGLALAVVRRRRATA